MSRSWAKVASGQLAQWTQAIHWYMNWLEICRQHERKARSIPERLKVPVHAVGARRGLAVNTRKRYAGWLTQFGAWVGGGDPRAVMDTIEPVCG